MSKIILTVGVSNAGKSTWASNYCNNNPNTIELNRDNIRFSCISPYATNWSEYKFNAFNEMKVTSIIQDQALSAIIQGKSIIISDTNLSPFSRDTWLNLAKKYNLDIEYVVFNTPFEELFYRNSSNLMAVPDHVITNQYKKFTLFLEEPLLPQVKYTVI